MWQFEHIVDSAAAPAQIYRCYEDAELRKRWDDGLLEVTLDGPFAAGMNGVMVIEGQGPLPFTIIAADPGLRFVDETVLPDAGVTLRFDHELLPDTDGGTQITHRLTITGPKVDQVGEHIGRMVSADFPDAMAALARLAETL